MNVSAETVGEEERLVAELELLGVGYLSRQTNYRADSIRPSKVLLADLMRQPSARVRAAVIAVLLSRPEYADNVPAALQRLQPFEELALRFLYTAAVLLQRDYSSQLRAFTSSRWQWLPDFFSTQLGLAAGGTPRDRLIALGNEHRRQTGIVANWVGTYENVVQRLLRHWELASQWNQ
jgi:hypothetical protein